MVKSQNIYSYMPYRGVDNSTLKPLFKSFLCASSPLSNRGGGRFKPFSSLTFSVLAGLLLAGQTYTALAQPSSNALPTGGSVVAGKATISQSQLAGSGRMTITQTSQRAVIDWNSFNVGQQATVNFNQPNAAAVTLNRVTGASASMINGAVNANGQVVFVNPNGVTFGKGAEINAAGVVATTMNISNNDFMSGKSTYTGSDQGRVINEGKITSNAVGGYIALLAPEVQNQGVLLATKGAGTVAIGAGEQITLNFQGNHLLGLNVDVATYRALIANKHIVEVNGGLVVMAASAANQLSTSVVNNTGKISASSMVNNGGTIELIGNTITQAGAVVANGNAQKATGGQINIVGSTITLASNSQTVATGTVGGGQVNIGLAATTVSGGTQVKVSNSSALTNSAAQVLVKTAALSADQNGQMAQVVTVEPNATINTSALQSGNGGVIAIWSQVQTTVAGILKSMGGALAGNGGFIETSSKGSVNLSPATIINTQAPNGRSGTWLLDPIDLTIDPAAANVISAALANNNVTIAVTANTNACPSLGACTQNGSGNLTIANGADILKAGTNLTTLTLSAAGIFNLNANISGQNLDVVIGASIAYLNVGSAISASQVTVQAQSIFARGSIGSNNYNFSGGAGSLGNVIQLLAQAIYVSGRIYLNASLPNNSATTVLVNGTPVRPEDLPTYLVNQNASHSTGQDLNQIYGATPANDPNGALTGQGQSNVIYLTARQSVNIEASAQVLANGTTGGLINIAAPTVVAQVGSLIQANGSNGFGGVVSIATTAGIQTQAISLAGTISANGASGGNISIVALGAPLTISGAITADGGSDQGGQVLVNHASDIQINHASISANGVINGGLITLVSDSGNLNLQSSLIQTNGGAGLGGTVNISALNNVTILGAVVAATGYTKGGTIKIGNDASTGTLPFALFASIDATSQLNASQQELSTGNQNGGLIETSGHALSMRASINAGRGGMWLIDPFDVVIAPDGTPTSGTPYSPGFAAGTPSVILASAIASSLQAGGSVSISTGSSTSNAIYVMSPITATGTGGLWLTGGTIYIFANIATKGSQSYTGNVQVGGDISLSSGDGLYNNFQVNGNISAFTGALTLQLGVGSYAGSAPSTGRYAVWFNGASIIYDATVTSEIYIGGLGRLAYLNTGNTYQYYFTPVGTFTGQVLMVGGGGGGGFQICMVLLVVVVVVVVSLAI